MILCLEVFFLPLPPGLELSKQNTLMKHIQNNQKSIGKSIPAYELKKSQEKDQQTKSLETFAKCSWFLKRQPYL
jgi:hypothetical protein